MYCIQTIQWPLLLASLLTHEACKQLLLRLHHFSLLFQQRSQLVHLLYYYSGSQLASSLLRSPPPLPPSYSSLSALPPREFDRGVVT